MRLVDADALDNMLADAQIECKRNGGNFRFGVLSTVRENIKMMPTVDAVPVVRCRDCKYYDSEPGGDIMMCYNGLGWTEQNDFCSKGERGESE